MPIEDDLVGLDVGDSPLEDCDSPLEDCDSPLEDCDTPLEVCDSPLEDSVSDNGGSPVHDECEQQQVQRALTSDARPLVTPCHHVLGSATSIRVSQLTSNQRRALGSADDQLPTSAPPIQREYIKVEAVEHDIVESGTLDMESDRPSPVRPGGKRRGRPPLRYRNGISRESGVSSRGRGVSSRGRGGFSRGRSSAAGKGGPASVTAISILSVPAKQLNVVFGRQHLMVRRDVEAGSRQVLLSEKELTFMELVGVKDSVYRLLEKASKSCDEGMISRLRAARIQAIGWVEDRLRSEASAASATPRGRKPTVGGAGKPGAVRGRPPRPLAPTSQSSRPQNYAMASHGDNCMDFDPDDPTDVPDGRTAADIAEAQRYKNSRDLGVLQAKQSDLSSVENELRRSVDFFGMEVSKDEARIKRLKIELEDLEKQSKQLDGHLLEHGGNVAFQLLDKDRRKAMDAQHPVVQACADMLTEVGHEDYVHLVSLGLPLLTPRELQERSRGANVPWLNKKVLRAANRTAKQQKKAAAEAAAADPTRRRRRPKGTVNNTSSTVNHSSSNTTAAVDAAVQQAVDSLPADSTDGDNEVVGTMLGGSDQISLPPDVLEQVMQGKGYLVDENGERLEIRVLPDGNVVAGSQQIIT